MSNHDPLRQYLEIITRMNELCDGLSMRDRLAVYQLAWQLTAANARTEALITPGGFLAEQTRQLDELRAMADRIARDVPDLEMERLFHEGDVDGMMQRLQQLKARGGDVQ